MTDPNTADTAASPSPQLDEQEAKLVEACEELLDHARHGRIYNLIVLFETPHPQDVRAHQLGVLVNSGLSKEFVKHAETAMMDIAEQRLGALPASGEQRRN
jgi:hypothetical protein